MNRSIVLLTLGLSYFATLLGCGDQSPGKSRPDNHQAERIPVAVTTVTAEDVVEKIEATGTVEAIHRAVVASQVAGEVIRIAIKPGDRVKRDQLLLQIDPRHYELSFKQAEAQWFSARAAFEKARADFQRNEKLHQTGDISDFVFENSRLQMIAAEANMKVAEAAMELARKQLEETRITAPFDGLISTVHTDLGNTVSPGMPLVTLVDLKQVKITVGVSEKDVARVKKGMPVFVTLEAHPGRRFEGRVAAVGPEADARARTFPVEIRLDNPAGLPLRAGMVARVNIIIKTLKQVPIIPLAALAEKGQSVSVFAVSDGRASKRLITTGPELDDRVAVLQGLRPGETVILLGQEKVTDGSLVKIVQEQ